MLLKELEVDYAFPCEANGTWKNKRREFQLSTRCMTSMIERLLPRIETKDCWKIVIEFTNERPRAEIQNMLGVYVVQRYLDIDHYNLLSNYEKKKCIINNIEESIENINLVSEYNLSALKAVCDTIRALDYKNEWYGKQKCKNGSLCAQLKVEHEVEYVKVFIVFHNLEDDSKKEVLIVKELPHEFLYAQYLGKLKWVNENTVRLVTKDGQVIDKKYKE